MKSNLSLKWSVFILAAFALSFLFFISRNPIEKVSASFSNQTSVNFSLPARLEIPKLNINTAIEDVGLASDGSMDVPKGPDDAAWFDLGPRPGETGSAVIDGHSGYKNNAPAVFDSLYKLQKGDDIYVQSADGTTTIFVVQGFRNYDPTANAENVFNSNDGKAHLNLITCSGDWNANAQTHSKRLVVFTDKE